MCICCGVQQWAHLRIEASVQNIKKRNFYRTSLAGEWRKMKKTHKIDLFFLLTLHIRSCFMLVLILSTAIYTIVHFHLPLWDISPTTYKKNAILPFIKQHFGSSNYNRLKCIEFESFLPLHARLLVSYITTLKWWFLAIPKASSMLQDRISMCKFLGRE